MKTEIISSNEKWFEAKVTTASWEVINTTVNSLTSLLNKFKK